MQDANRFSCDRKAVLSKKIIQYNQFYLCSHRKQHKEVIHGNNWKQYNGISLTCPVIVNRTKKSVWPVPSKKTIQMDQFDLSSSRKQYKGIRLTCQGIENSTKESVWPDKLQNSVQRNQFDLPSYQNSTNGSVWPVKLSKTVQRNQFDLSSYRKQYTGISLTCHRKYKM